MHLNPTHCTTNLVTLRYVLTTTITILRKVVETQNKIFINNPKLQVESLVKQSEVKRLSKQINTDEPDQKVEE